MDPMAIKLEMSSMNSCLRNHDAINIMIADDAIHDPPPPLNGVRVVCDVTKSCSTLCEIDLLTYSMIMMDGDDDDDPVRSES